MCPPVLGYRKLRINPDLQTRRVAAIDNGSIEYEYRRCAAEYEHEYEVKSCDDSKRVCPRLASVWDRRTYMRMMARRCC